MAEVVPMVEPELATIRHHLETTFGWCRDAYPGGLVEIAYTSDRGLVERARLFPITPAGLDGAADFAVARNRERRNVYLGANPRKPGTHPERRASDSDIEIAKFNFIDCDTADAAIRLKAACPLPYTFVVITGRVPTPRPHAYWELDEPTHNMPAWVAQQSALADHFHSDRVIDPPRIMRLAGTVNYPTPKKHLKGYRTELVSIRTEYDDERRQPVPASALWGCYPLKAPDPHEANGAEVHGINADGAHFILRSNAGSDPEDLLAEIAAGRNLHTNARDLVALMVGRGYADWTIRHLLDGALRPVSDGGTLSQIDHFIRTARTKFGVAEPKEGETAASPEEDEGAGQFGPLEFQPFALANVAELPPRRWLVEHMALGGALAAIVAPGGLGKSTLFLQTAIAVVTNRPAIIGVDHVEACPVWIHCAEDDADEMQRRIRAILEYFAIDPAEIAGRLYITTTDEFPLKLVQRAPKGGLVRSPDIDRIITFVRERQIGLVGLDPLAEISEAEENDNNEMHQVVAAVRDIARETTAAVVLAHHAGKANAQGSNGNGLVGNQHAARGASSFGAAARVVLTLAPMSEQDAEMWAVPPCDRHLYVRIDDAKFNMALVTYEPRWFKRIGVKLLNGDEVGVLEPQPGMEKSSVKAERVNPQNDPLRLDLFRRLLVLVTQPETVASVARRLAHFSGPLGDSMNPYARYKTSDSKGRPQAKTALRDRIIAVCDQNFIQGGKRLTLTTIDGRRVIIPVRVTPDQQTEDYPPALG